MTDIYFQVLEILHGFMEMYGHKDIRSRVFLHVLDILNQDSIDSLKQRLLENYGGKYSTSRKIAKNKKIKLL